MDKTECRIVLVDDEGILLTLEKKTLEHAGYREIACFSDSREAAVHLERNDTHVLISDLNMPEIDGFAFLCSHPKIPFKCLVSAATDRLEVLQSDCAQSNIMTISKPFSSEALVDCVNRAFQYLNEEDNGCKTAQSPNRG